MYKAFFVISLIKDKSCPVYCHRDSFYNPVIFLKKRRPNTAVHVDIYCIVYILLLGIRLCILNTRARTHTRISC